MHQFTIPRFNILENDLATLCVEHEKLLNEYKVYKDKCKTAEENSKFSEIKINDLSSLLASFHLKCENISKFLYVAHLLDPLLCQWTFRLFPCLGY